MKRLEIIHLRSPGESLESLSRRIRESIRADCEGDEAVILYRRHGLGTDLAVHILHSGGTGGLEPSGLALRLASALRAHGLVEHTLWEELR
jgi:hypothetical protein